MRTAVGSPLRLVLLGLAAIASAFAIAAAPGQGRSVRVAVASSGCANPAARRAGQRTIRLEVGGTVRSAVVRVPRAALGDPAPLVLAFHGTGGSGPFMSRYSGLSPISSRAGFIAVYPSADESQERWTVENSPRSGAPDDVAFVHALLAELGRKQCVDLSRVSLVGVSNGGSLVARLACELPDPVAGVAIVAGGFSEPRVCAASRRLSVLEIHGTSDPVVPYNGREGGTGAVIPWLRTWVRRDGCANGPGARTVAARVKRISWTRCPAGRAVEHLQIVGGTHQWPGATPADPGPKSTISAAREIWRFLAPRVSDAG